MTTTLKLDDITADLSCQLRADGYDLAAAAEYAEAMRAGATFPAVTVFHDGETYWLADGFHRHAAAEVAGLDTIEADVREGGKLEAKIHAAGANASHGVRLSTRDKRNIVNAILDEPALADKGSREIADICGVSHTLVANMRRERSQQQAVNGLHVDPDADEALPESVEDDMPPYEEIPAIEESLPRAWVDRLGDRVLLFHKFDVRLFASFKRSIAEMGVLEPVIIDQHGDVIDGSHRVLAWTQLRAEGVDVPDYPRRVHVCEDDDERQRLYLRGHVYRKSHTPYEKGKAARWFRDQGYTFEEICEELVVFTARGKYLLKLGMEDAA